MKKSVLFLFSTLLVWATIAPFLTGAAAAANKVVKVALDGTVLKFTDAQPYLDANGKVMVPLRFVGETLGATVKPDGRTITVTQEGVEAVLTIGNRTATVNKRDVNLGTVSVIKGSRTFVPLRFVSEVFGRRVLWDGKNSTAHIWNVTGLAVLEKESVRPEWGKDMAPEHVSYDLFDISNGKLTFENSSIWNGASYKGYTFKETRFPDANKKFITALQLMADEKNYTEVMYYPKYDSMRAYASLIYSRSPGARRNGDYYFGFSINETAYTESHASKKVFANLGLNSLFWEEDTKGTRIVPYVENRFRIATVALFGESTGLKIFNYAMELYNTMTSREKRTAIQNTTLTKKIDDIQVDFSNIGGVTIYLSFSKV